MILSITDNSRSAMYSSKPKASGTLAAQLGVLREFANLRDERIETFGAECPDFVLSKALTEDGWLAGVVERLGEGSPRMMSARALMLAETIRKLQPNPALRKRDILRLIWRGDDSANDYLKVLLAGSRTEFDWKRGELMYKPQNDFEKAVYALFRNSKLAKVCGNPDCPAPLFIAQRKSQCYCGEDCAQVYQKEWKRKWWKNRGSSRRQKQRASKRRSKKGGKR
jgi:hypothetical protein